MDEHAQAVAARAPCGPGRGQERCLGGVVDEVDDRLAGAEPAAASRGGASPAIPSGVALTTTA